MFDLFTPITGWWPKFSVPLFISCLPWIISLFFFFIQLAQILSPPQCTNVTSVLLNSAQLLLRWSSISHCNPSACWKYLLSAILHQQELWNIASQGAICLARAACTAWGRCSLVPGPGLMPIRGNLRAGHPNVLLYLYKQCLLQYQTTDPLAELDATLSFLRYHILQCFLHSLQQQPMEQGFLPCMFYQCRSHIQMWLLLSNRWWSFCSYKQQTVKWAFC